MNVDEVGEILEHQGLSDDEIDAFFEHQGVKGMRWGVRRQRRVNTLLKVGSGKGTLGEKARAAWQVSTLDFIRGHGSLKKAANIRGTRQKLRNDRINKGEASVRDKIAFYGGTKYQDILPTGKSEHNTKAAVGATIAGALVAAWAGGVVSRGLGIGTKL
jgi:hypothetical protein